MRKLIFVVLFLLTPTVIFSNEQDKNLLESCVCPTIIVGFGNNTGTGAVVRSEPIGDGEFINVAISCAHVVYALPKKVGVGKYDGDFFVRFESFPSHVYAVDRQLDLSVIFFRSNHKIPCADVDLSSELKIGSQVVSVGCGSTTFPRLDIGIISLLVANKSHFGTSLTSVPGDSGGPIYKDFKIIGIKQAMGRTHFMGRPLPCHTIANIISVTDFKKLSSNYGNLDFVFDQSKPIPKWLVVYSLLADSELRN